MPYDLDLSEERCPCCGAKRAADHSRRGRWPWDCGCDHCPWVALGRVCKRAGPCWVNCPYKAPDGCQAGKLCAYAASVAQ